jgi:hypothetical protein
MPIRPSIKKLIQNTVHEEVQTTGSGGQYPQVATFSALPTSAAVNDIYFVQDEDVFYAKQGDGTWKSTATAGGVSINDSSTTSTSQTWSANKINTQLGTKEPAISKKTAFNVDFGGTGSMSYAARSDHNHDLTYEPKIATKGTAFNKDFGSGSGTVTEGNDARLFTSGTKKTEVERLGVSANGVVTVDGVEQASAGTSGTGGAAINDASTTSTTETWSASKINTELTGKEPAIGAKKSGFNLDVGSTAGTLAAGNHTHSNYEPTIGTKGTAFNKDFAGNGSAATVARSDHNHDLSYAQKSSEHSHSNKGTLDKITQSGVESSVDISNIHTHSNKASLDRLGVSVNNIVTVDGVEQAGGGGGGAVSSVNGKTGAVTLAASDVGAIASPNLPVIGQMLTFNGTNWVASDAPQSGVKNYTQVTVGAGATVTIANTAKALVIQPQVFLATDLGTKMNPTMTANTIADGSTISASSTYSGLQPYMAMNGATSDSWATLTNSQNNSWLQLMLPNAIQYDGFRIYCAAATSSQAPKTFYIQGSNDGSSWTQISDTFVFTPFVGDTWQTYMISNPGTYKYYRLFIVGVQSGTNARVYELEYYQGTFIRSRLMKDTDNVTVEHHSDGIYITNNGASSITLKVVYY